MTSSTRLRRRPRPASTRGPVLAFAIACACGVLAGSAAAQTVTYNGRMGDRALLVIGGQPRVVAPGQSVDGVRLDAMSSDEARVVVGGRTVTLRPGTPVNIARSGDGDGAGGREIVLPAGSGGHFFANGLVNHSPMRFVVDTGATLVSIGAADADRMGIDYKSGEPIAMNTANGVAMARRILLTSLRIGDVELHQVPAVVQPGISGIALLGNSFLSHFDMQRSGDTMRLTRKD